ncbi:MAG: hypothetical protein HOV81_25105 [Kofleriaceae bacterium]|nr:hypothetical protein [Kofleriaceae bacterium]
MIRWAVLLTLLGCEPSAELQEPPPRTWVYAPSLAAWPLGPITGHIGRSQAPQVAPGEGITGDVASPLRLPTAWPVDGTPARAAIYGLDGGKPAVELVDIDGGRVLWRDTTACAAPIVGVTGDAIVCADAKGTRAIGLDGKSKWKSDATFIAMTDDRVVTAAPGESVILDAASGNEIARVKLSGLAPRSTTRTATGSSTSKDGGTTAAKGQVTAAPSGAKATTTPAAGTPAVATGISSDSILASCGDAGRELFAYGQDGQLVRIVEGQGGPKIAWSVPVPVLAGLDACDGTNVLVTTVQGGGTSLVALARETGEATGTIDGVRGYWPARDGSDRIEVSAHGAVARHARDLAGAPEHVALPVLEELLAKRGDLRLVRATEHTAALLDARGVRAFLPLAQRGAVLGDTALVAASWLGSPGETVQRVAYPPRYDRTLRVSGAKPSVAVTAELRDLPQATRLDASGAIAKDGVGNTAVSHVALDPIQPAVFALAVDVASDGTTTSTLARFDLAAKSWSWTRGGACGAGAAVGLAVTRDLVVCAARDGANGTVAALSRDGAPRWQWRNGNVDAVQAAGDAVLVFDADLMYVLDASDGHLLGTFDSDDGAAMRATVLDIAGMTLVVTAEHNRVMARLPRVRMVPAWTLAVAGVVAEVSAAGDGVLVALEDGDAYRVDGRTGAAVAVAGLNLTWRGEPDFVAAGADGGPIPPSTMPTAEATPAPEKKGRKKTEERDPDGPPRLPQTWRTPTDLPASWQLTIYDVDGALRTRNDYALAQPITPGRARRAGAPLVVQSGPGLMSVLVIDPERGDPLRQIELSEPSSTTFSTVVDGKPVTGAMLANPLRAVLF